MAENKLERTYTIPLRLQWMKVPNYKRTRKGIVTIKEFIARHMKVPNRDLDKVKLDVYLNNEVWFRGPRGAPSKVTVKAIKDKEIVHVTFVEIPKHVGFAKAKHLKLHKKTDKKESPKVEEKKEEKTEEQKKDESEKEKATAISNEKIAEQQAKADKKTTAIKTPKINRMALKK